MTLSQLRAFLAAYELGTFTAAADELDVSQASVSELVGRLETELACALFVRGRRRLVPSAAAHELVGHARRTLASADAAVQAVRSLTGLEGGVATFGVPRNALFYGISETVVEFHAAYPAVRLRMIGINSHLVAEAVLSGELEAGLVVLPVGEEDLDVEPLAVDEAFLATAAPMPGERAARLDDLLGPGLILYDAASGWRDPTRRQLLERANQEGRSLEAAVEVEFVDTALRLVAVGAGATIVSGSIVRAGAVPDGVHVTPFEQRFLETLALVRRRGASTSRATEAIAEAVRARISAVELPRTA